MALFVVVCLVTYISVGVFLPYANEEQARRELADKAKALVSELRQRPALESGALFLRFYQETGADLFLLNEEREAIDPFTFSETDMHAVPEQEYPFRFADANKEYILAVRYNPVRSEEVSRAIWRSLPWVGCVVLLLSCLSAFLFSRYTTRPIVRMSKTAANIADLDFSWYCPDMREDEIGMLAKSINELSDKLSEALSALHRRNMSLEDTIALEKERERRRLLFFSGVSHELKTPVAIVIGQLEGMQAGIGVYKDREKYLARSAEILHTLDHFIREILSVSHMDIAGAKAFASTDLSAVLDASLRDLEPVLETGSLCLVKEIEPHIVLTGDAALLQKAFGNILGNAAVYTPEGGSVDVCFTRKQGETILTVTNRPAQIDAAHLPHLFEAFYRVDRQAKGFSGHGSGLGLYITGMILDCHGASYTIENFGDGVRFSVVF